MNTSIGKRGFLLALWLAVTGIFAQPLVAQETTLTPFNATYSVDHTWGNGKTRVRLETLAGESSYLYESRTRATGFVRMFVKREAVETSQFHIDGGRFVTTGYQFDDGTRKGKYDRWLKFDWEQNKVESYYKGQTVTLDVEEGTTDRLAVVVALMHDLMLGKPQLEYKLVDKNAPKIYRFELVGEEEIDTSQGRLQTVIYERQRKGSRRKGRIWFARDLKYLPVRFEHFKDDDRDTVMALTAVEWTSEDASLAQK